jgi:hypothetical protein
MSRLSKPYSASLQHFMTWAVAAIMLSTAAADEGEEKETSTQEPVTISLAEGQITMQAPAEWETRKPAVNILEYEFAVAPVEGDDNPGRVTVMGAGGGVEANINRWMGQFEQPDGSSTKDLAKVEKRDIDGAEVHIVSITGTYHDTPGGGPFTRTKVVKRPGYRMLSAIIVTPESGHYFIKLYGPQKTVDAQEDAFQKMLESLQVKAAADAESRSP